MMFTSSKAKLPVLFEYENLNATILAGKAGVEEELYVLVVPVVGKGL